MGVFAAEEEADIDERCDKVKRIGDPRHRVRPVEGESPGEYGQPAKDLLGRRRQQVVAPGDGVAQRAQPDRLVAGTLGEQEKPVAQPRAQCGGREQPRAGGRQLDCQRQPIEPVADLRDVRCVGGRQRERQVGGGCSLDEETHSILADPAAAREIHARPRAGGALYWLPGLAVTDTTPGDQR